MAPLVERADALGDGLEASEASGEVRGQDHLARPAGERQGADRGPRHSRTSGCLGDGSEFDYQPTACKQAYRVVVLCKNLTVARGERLLFDDIRYFFYITNDRTSLAEEIVFQANDRCNQENLIAQLKSGVSAMRMPVDNLVSNWAYMVMASLAWTLKAWLALVLPVAGRWKDKHEAQKRTVLRMEFKTFLNALCVCRARWSEGAAACVPAAVVEPVAMGVPAGGRGGPRAAVLSGGLDVGVRTPRFAAATEDKGCRHVGTTIRQPHAADPAAGNLRAARRPAPTGPASRFACLRSRVSTGLSAGDVPSVSVSCNA